jgi:hypothetical protein
MSYKTISRYCPFNYPLVAECEYQLTEAWGDVGVGDAYNCVYVKVGALFLCVHDTPRVSPAHVN